MKVRILIYIILFILATRIALFENATIWKFYHQAIFSKELSTPTERAFIRLKSQTFTKKQLSIPYLALGSSQTVKLYSNYARHYPDRLKIFFQPKLQPFHFLLHKTEIERIQPKTILLYLSEFDLATKPFLTPLALSTSNNTLFLMKNISQFKDNKYFLIKYLKLLSASLISEYKYSFVFKNLLKKFSNENSSLPPKSIKKLEGKSTIEKTYNHAKFLEGNFSEEFIDHHLYFLEKFLKFTHNNNINVVIVESQYSPLITFEAADELNRKVIPKLLNLTRNYAHVLFISKNDFPKFQVEDFVDLTHVNAHAGYQFSNYLIQNIVTPYFQELQ